MRLATSARRVLPVVVLVAGALSSASVAADMRPIHIQRVTVLPQGQSELFGMLAYEFSREPVAFGQEVDYDNLRVGPLGIRFGAGNGLEFGGHLTFNANSGDGSDDPDDSGLEALTGFAKIGLTDQLAVEGGVRIAGDDEVGPYPMDGIDFYVNLAAEQPIGPQGKIYGEFGITVQDNDGFGGTYENWGIGYAHRINPELVLNAELVGDSAPGVYGAGNHMDVVLGASFTVQRAMVVKPFMSVGVYDASPDAAFGVGFEMPL